MADFFPLGSPGRNAAQDKVWDALKRALEPDDEAVAYHEYPHYRADSADRRHAPDILMLHRRYGLWVFECKSIRIEQIVGIHGSEWEMRDFYDQRIQPVQQAEDQMFAVVHRLNDNRQTRNLLRNHCRVCLPTISRQAWQQAGWADLPSTGNVLLQEDLTPAALRKVLEAATAELPQQSLSDQQWQLLLRRLGGRIPNVDPRPVPSSTPPMAPIRVMRQMEERLLLLDHNQTTVAYAAPEGPQRIRGLAGTGKTVLLAHRAAKLHASQPAWRIAFVFYTRSLYDQVRNQVRRAFNDLLSSEEDEDLFDPDLLQVLHAWGGREQPGFCSEVAVGIGVRPLSLSAAQELAGPHGDGFDAYCRYLLDHLQRHPDYRPYDAILIDEGQDLPPSFYQLAHRLLKPPHRLYWAYDECQGIGSLVVPSSEALFGRDAQGNLRVNVSGRYPGGISRSEIMSATYRTPRCLLMAAHAINMGLYRPGGPLQGVTRKQEWENLGYRVVEGDFSNVSVREGRQVVLERPAETSPHPVDQPDFPALSSLGDQLQGLTFANEQDERRWIAESIAHDLQGQFRPEDILVTGPDSDYQKSYLQKLQQELQACGVTSVIAGEDTDRSVFRVPGAVTLSVIQRAKGNEANKVYVCRFHAAIQPLAFKGDNELNKRNEAFVALTRARVWCVVTGLDSSIFQELAAICQDLPQLKFPAFNQASLRRITAFDPEADED